MGNIYLGQHKVHSGKQTTYEQPLLAAVAVERILDELVEALREPRKRVDYLIATIGLLESDLPVHLRKLRTALTSDAIGLARDHVKARLSLSGISLSYTLQVPKIEGSCDNFADAEINFGTYKLLGLESARTHIDLTALLGVGVRCDLTIFCLPSAGRYLHPIVRPEHEAEKALGEKAREIEEWYAKNREYDEALRSWRETANALGAGRETEVSRPQAAQGLVRPPESAPVLYRESRARVFEFPWAADLTLNFSIFDVNRVLNLYTAECLFITECCD